MSATLIFLIVCAGVVGVILGTAIRKQRRDDVRDAVREALGIEAPDPTPKPPLLRELRGAFREAELKSGHRTGRLTRKRGLPPQ